MRVSVFDPHPVVHKGLTRLLPRHGFSVVSQSFDGRKAISTIRQARPDIVLTDVLLPHVDGLKVLELMQEAELQVPTLVFCAQANPTFVARAIALGASDFVLKTGERLIPAMKDVSEKKQPPEDCLFQTIRSNMQSRSFFKSGVAGADGLTDREMQVWKHLGYGLSNREIAKSLQISVETVKEHVQNILRKQNSVDRTEAAVRAVRQGLT